METLCIAKNLLFATMNFYDTMWLNPFIRVLVANCVLTKSPIGGFRGRLKNIRYASSGHF